MVSLQMPVVVCRTIGLNNDAELHATADELDATAAVFVAAVENSDDIDANIDGLVRWCEWPVVETNWYGGLEGKERESVRFKKENLWFFL